MSESIRYLTLTELQDELKKQGVEDSHDYAVVCPMCGDPQSIRSLMIKGGLTESEARERIGFSCVGRVTGSGPYKKDTHDPGTGCDWSLGGLLKMHTLEIMPELGSQDGETAPFFEPATPEQAQTLRASLEAQN